MTLSCVTSKILGLSTYAMWCSRGSCGIRGSYGLGDVNLGGGFGREGGGLVPSLDLEASVGLLLPPSCSASCYNQLP